tara:strand:+ start:59 stop:673 length:615 start_codon:yes stop_codon:yes gene_type:complete
MYIDFGKMTAQQVYITMTQTIVPRPIAWVLSENPDQSLNLAPYSYFNAVCSDPPLLMISAGVKPDGATKDTRDNIRDRKEFVVHIASLDQLDEMNASSANFAPGVSEIEALGLETEKFEGSRLPRLSDAKVAFACSVYDIQTLGDSLQSLILGEVNGVFVDDEAIAEDEKGRSKILADKINPIGRLGASEYVSFGEILTRRRPD